MKNSNINKKVAYFFRSLDFAFVDKNMNNIFHIVLADSDEEKFAKENYNSKQIISLHIKRKKNFSEMSPEEVIKLSDLTFQLKRREISNLLVTSDKIIDSWAKKNDIKLYCVPYKLKNKFENKIFFENFLNVNKLLHPGSKVIYSTKAEIPFKKSVIQIPNSRGAEGTFIANSEKKYREIIKNKKFPLLVREYVDGIPLSSSIFIDKEKIFLTGIERQCFVRKNKNELGDFIGIQWLPYDFFDKMTYKTIEDSLIEISSRLRKQGLNGLINLDFILGEDGLVYFIECNPRIACATNQIIATKELRNNIDFVDLLNKFHCSVLLRTKGNNNLPLSKYCGTQIFLSLNANKKSPVKISRHISSGFYKISKKGIEKIALKSHLDFVNKKNIVLFYNETNHGEVYKNNLDPATLLSNQPLCDFNTGELNELGKLLYKHFNLNENTRL